MLADPLGPLAIRPSHIPRLTPWLVRYALNVTPAARERTIAAISALNSRALPAYRDLLEAAGAREELIERGMLKVVNRENHLPGLHSEAHEFCRRGGKSEIVSAEQLGELETALRGRVVGGVLFPGVAHITDPYRISTAFARRIVLGGGQIKECEVRAILVDPRGCRILTDTGELRARQCVLAAGFWSSALIKPFGMKAPLEAERGYHLALPHAGVEISRPLYFHTESFVATPLRGSLRLAGTAEFSGATAAPDWRRASVLFSLARRYLPNIDDSGATRWMGHRPSFPDSLPALGRVPDAPQVLYAFGHQHLGLTQAAISAECIAALANDRAPPVDLSPFSLRRFS